MKKTNLFLSAIILAALSINAKAQTPWGGIVLPNTNTFTTDHVGIGFTAVPTDAKLHINTSVSNVSGGDNIPSIKIDLYEGMWMGCMGTPCPPPNTFEIWSNTVGIPPVPPPTLLDVIDPMGQLGIMQPNPQAPLDVNGNGIIEKISGAGDGRFGIIDVTGNVDATVHIYGYPTPVHCTDHPATDHRWEYLHPELWIDRRICTDCTPGCQPIVPQANLFQVGTSSGLNGVAAPTGSPNILDVINPNGWLGVLQPNPSAPLDVKGNALVENNLTVNGGQIDMTIPGDGAWSGINAHTSANGLGISTGSAGGAYIQMYGATNTSPGAMGSMNFGVGNDLSASGATFWSYSSAGGGSGWSALMRIKPNGKVAIGADIISPENLPGIGTYNLYVSKGILTEKLKVQLITDPWSDFVFNKDYNLKPLSEVESYVKANNHLPEIPSAGEVAKEGIDVGSMDAKLLQKIEELTLYVIQQQKQLGEQQNQIELLKKKLN